MIRCTVHHRGKSLLVWAQFILHLICGIKNLHKFGSVMAVILGGLTSVLQFFYVRISNRFKESQGRMDGKGRQDLQKGWEHLLSSLLYIVVRAHGQNINYDVVHVDAVVVVYSRWQRLMRCYGETWARRRRTVPMKTVEASDIYLDSDLHDYLPLSARSEHDYEGF